MTIARPTVLVHKTVLDGFRRRAWKAYPLEYIEQVLGRVSENGFEIRILTPVVHQGSPLAVNYDHDIDDIHESEDLTKSQFLGYIHTHIGARVCEHPSEEDYLDALANNELLSGVCLLYKSGGKRHSVFHFEIPQAPMVLKIATT